MPRKKTSKRPLFRRTPEERCEPYPPMWTVYPMPPKQCPLTPEEQKRRNAPLNHRNQGFRLLK